MSTSLWDLLPGVVSLPYLPILGEWAPDGSISGSDSTQLGSAAGKKTVGKNSTGSIRYKWHYARVLGYVLVYTQLASVIYKQWYTT